MPVYMMLAYCIEKNDTFYSIIKPSFVLKIYFNKTITD